MIIAKRFEKHPGHKKIQQREYAIEEGTTGRELSRATEWCMSLRPGQKVDMSVMFPENSALSNHCPHCHTRSASSSETRTQW